MVTSSKTLSVDCNIVYMLLNRYGTSCFKVADRFRFNPVRLKCCTRTFESSTIYALSPWAKPIFSTFKEDTIGSRVDVVSLHPGTNHALFDKMFTKLRVKTGKPVPVGFQPDPTRTRRTFTRPDPARGYGSGTGKPAGTGIPADPYNLGNVRNLVNVGRWRNGHTLRTLRENMETKLHQ